MTRSGITTKGPKAKTRRIRRPPSPADPADRMRPPWSPTPEREVTEARFELVRDLLLLGIPGSLVHKAIEERVTPTDTEELEHPRVVRKKRALAERIGWPFPPRQSEYAYERVRAQIREMFDSELPTARAVQSARLETDLARVSIDLASVPPGKRGSLYHAKARIYERLERVQGTAAPTEIRVDPSLGARQTLIAVVMALSPDESARLIEEQRAIEAHGPADDAGPRGDD